MKNHAIINNKCLQLNKKWSHLKQKQKMWILERLKYHFNAYISEHPYVLKKPLKDTIINRVYDEMEEREIWLPFHEAKIHMGKSIDRLNRKHFI